MHNSWPNLLIYKEFVKFSISLSTLLVWLCSFSIVPRLSWLLLLLSERWEQAGRIQLRALLIGHPRILLSITTIPFHQPFIVIVFVINIIIDFIIIIIFVFVINIIIDFIIISILIIIVIIIVIWCVMSICRLYCLFLQFLCPASPLTWDM